MAEQENRELGWDEEVENSESEEYILLSPGDYDFTIETFERSRHEGGGKAPACNKAVLKLRVEAPEGSALITESLFLYDKMQWKIAQFFLCIGEKEVNGKIKMNWSAVPGAKGRATIEVIADKNNPEKKYNHVKKYLPYEPKKYEPGRF